MNCIWERFCEPGKRDREKAEKLVRKQYDALTHIDFRDKTHKAILRIVIVNFVILLVVELVSLMCGFEFYALVIYSIVLFLILRSFSWMYREVSDAASCDK